MTELVITGDCVEIMRLFPSESIDVVFADPPFNLGKKYKSNRDSLGDSEYERWSELWLTEAARVVKQTGSVFVTNTPKNLIHSASVLSKIMNFKHWIAWDSPTSPMGKSLQPGHYGILYFYKERPKFYEIRSCHKRCRSCGEMIKDYGGKKAMAHVVGPLLSDVWTDIHRVRHKRDRDDHPCQLPQTLLERIVIMSTDPGDVILDPFGGTGTTAAAARRFGRGYISIDIDASYTEITTKKLESVKCELVDGIGVSTKNGKIVTVRDVDVEKLDTIDICQLV